MAGSANAKVTTFERVQKSMPSSIEMMSRSKSDAFAAAEARVRDGMGDGMFIDDLAGTSKLGCRASTAVRRAEIVPPLPYELLLLDQRDRLQVSTRT